MIDGLLDGPEPPGNVRAVYRDGREVPCELVYAGQDDAGLHHWVAVTPIPLVDLLTQLATVKIGMLPAKTSVGITTV